MSGVQHDGVGADPATTRTCLGFVANFGPQGRYASCALEGAFSGENIKILTHQPAPVAKTRAGTILCSLVPFGSAPELKLPNSIPLHPAKDSVAASFAPSAVEIQVQW